MSNYGTSSHADAVLAAIEAEEQEQLARQNAKADCGLVVDGDDREILEFWRDFVVPVRFSGSIATRTVDYHVSPVALRSLSRRWRNNIDPDRRDAHSYTYVFEHGCNFITRRSDRCRFILVDRVNPRRTLTVEVRDESNLFVVDESGWNRGKVAGPRGGNAYSAISQCR